MSAFTAMIHLDGAQADRESIGRMNESMAMRGPDGAATWIGGSAAMGHLLFETTPQAEHEAMPLRDAESLCVLTGDLRLDEREKLGAALGFDRKDIPTLSDSALALAGYRKWGERVAEHLLGDFAFVIWDQRSRRCFCARDAMGVKPLYYFRCAGSFLAATEIKALLASGRVPKELNEIRVADHLVALPDDKRSTFYRDVFRLAPGHAMVVSPEGARETCYWKPEQSNDLRLGGDEAYAEAFGEVFRRCVESRLASSGNRRVGAALSGGLDSSAIACVARERMRESGGQLLTYSAVFDATPECDERRYIQTVLDGGGIEPHTVHDTELSPLGSIGEQLRQEDEAFNSPNLFMHWALHRKAAKTGASVFLDGFDGDSAVSHGEHYLSELAAQGRWDDFRREAAAWEKVDQAATLDSSLHEFAYPQLHDSARAGRWDRFARDARAISKRFDASMSSMFLREGLRPATPESLKRGLRKMRGRSGAGRLAGRMIAPDFARRVGLADRLRDANVCTRAPKSEIEMHVRKLSAGYLPASLELLDRSAAAAGVEPRYPFFDRRLIEFCLSIPAEQKMQAGWTRSVMRRAMRGALPEAIRTRADKADFGPSFSHSLIQTDRKALKNIALEDPGEMGRFVDLAALQARVRRCLSAGGGEADSMRLWAPVTLGLWLRQTHLAR